MNTGKLCVVLLFFIGSVAKGQDTLPVYEIISDTVFEKKLDKSYWQKLADKEGKWTIENIKSVPLTNRFHFAGTPAISGDTIAATNWIRFSLRNFVKAPVKISIGSGSELSEFFVVKNNNVISSITTGWKYPWRKKKGIKSMNALPVVLNAGEEVTVYVKKQNKKPFHIPSNYSVPLYVTDKIYEKEFFNYQDNFIEISHTYLSFISGLLFLAAIFNLLIYSSVKNKVNLYFSFFLLSLFLWYQPFFRVILSRESIFIKEKLGLLLSLWVIFFMFFVRHYFEVFKHYPRWDKFLIIFPFIMYVAGGIVTLNSSDSSWIQLIMSFFFIAYMLSIIITVVLNAKFKGQHNKIFYLATSPLLIFLTGSLIISLVVKNNNVEGSNALDYIGGACIVWAVIVFSKYLFEDYGKQQQRIMQVQIDKEKEQVQFIAKQKVDLENKVAERTQELKQSLEELKSTQTQLIQSEKMASLGELTAGIAHEIQNPLNFVNNFSEVNKELVAELHEEALAGNIADVVLLATAVDENLTKVINHGKRADSIVKSMLQHSRKSAGEKDWVDINSLVDEYLRLSYHGIRAKDKNFNCILETHFDPTIEKIEIAGQDIGRVLLNLFNNAFYAVNEKKTTTGEGYQPLVQVTVVESAKGVEIKVKDNGNGIPEKVIDKIYQPFFTTKPTGEGTGLGLSLSYDIITKGHGGQLKVQTEEGKGTEFTISLPLKNLEANSYETTK